MAILVAIAVNEDGYREVLGAAEGMREDKASWVSFFQWLKGRGLDGVKLIVGDKCLDTVDNSQINVLTQRTMHRICTAATNEEVSFAYRVAIPRQRFRWRNAFSTRWRSL